jgi:hypothetical protein
VQAHFGFDVLCHVVEAGSEKETRPGSGGQLALGQLHEEAAKPLNRRPYALLSLTSGVGQQARPAALCVEDLRASFFIEFPEKIASGINRAFRRVWPKPDPVLRDGERAFEPWRSTARRIEDTETDVDEIPSALRQTPHHHRAGGQRLPRPAIVAVLVRSRPRDRALVRPRQCSIGPRSGFQFGDEVFERHTSGRLDFTKLCEEIFFIEGLSRPLEDFRRYSVAREGLRLIGLIAFHRLFL